MKARRGVVGAFVGLMLAAACVPVFGAESDEAPLADRIAALADRLDNSAASAEVKSRLYEAASRLSEKEVRFRRERYYSAKLASDSDASLAALTEWRKLEPDNVFVQSRLIDAYLGRMETADAKLGYVKTVSEAETVNSEVRSHAAYKAAEVLLEQSRYQQAYDMVRKSLTLDPLNTESLEAQRRLTIGASTPMQRVNQLLALLKANPGSVDAVALVAAELANANMVQDSLQWYAHAVGMAKPLGGLGGQAAREYAAELLIGGQDRAAGEIAARLLERDSSEPVAWFLTLLAERNMKDRFEQVKKSALIGLVNNLAMARTEVGVKNATTRPLGSEEAEIPDLAGDVDLVKQASDLQRERYVAAASDVAWFLVFYGDQADKAQAIAKVIQSVDLASGSLVARLQGWALMKAGKLDEARVRLAGVAANDPLAELAIIRMDRQDPAMQAKVTEAAKRLVQNYPSRLVGAIVRNEVGDLAGQLPMTTSAEAIRDSLDRFPREVLRLSLAPQEFVMLRLTPRQVGHDFAEPILMDVELRNMQDMPLVVGPTGMVRDVWVDAQARGLVQVMVPGVSFEPVDGPVRLQGNATMRWTTRVDRGPLADVLEHNVLQPLQLSVSGLTNAVPTEAGIAPGTCGVRGHMNQMLERRAGALTSDAAIRKARGVVDSSDAAAKLALVDQVAAHLRLLAEPETAAVIKPLEPELRDLLLKLSADSSVAVRSWAHYQMRRANVEQLEKVSDELVGENLWYGRLIAVAAVADQPGEVRQKVLKRLEGDADATVRRLAQAVEALPVAATTKTNSVR